jgi:TonB family protein
MHLSRSSSKTRIVVISIAGALIFTALSVNIAAQGTQLSLADILIALRSKKVTLTDRNKILSEAVAARGTTFTLTPEIEKELADTGASKVLLDSLRRRVQSARTTDVEPRPKIEAPASAPVVQPPVEDLAFFQRRAEESVSKGELDSALVDYTKAAEMNPSSVSVLMGRGQVYLKKRSFILAIADFTKVLELDPKNAVALALRAGANEGQGNASQALDDYKKAYELDPSIESAKAAVEKFNEEQRKLAESLKPVPPPPPPLPEYVDLGTIDQQRATKMIKPNYPQTALHSGFGGKVIVEIEIDKEGNVTRAKAVSGNSLLRNVSEDAAIRSKFQPATVGNVPVKAKAQIVYDFIVRP